MESIGDGDEQSGRLLAGYANAVEHEVGTDAAGDSGGLGIEVENEDGNEDEVEEDGGEGGGGVEGERDLGREGDFEIEANKDSKENRRRLKSAEAAAWSRSVQDWSATGTLLSLAVLMFLTHVLFVLIPSLQHHQSFHQSFHQPFHQPFDVRPSNRRGSLVRSCVSASALFGFTGLWVWSYVQCIRTPPGEVPDTPEWTEQVNLHRVFERDEDGELRFNERVGKFLPDRAHYDRQSKSLVLRMDHYCPWTVSAVGFYNYKYFLLTVFYAALTSLYFLFSAISTFRESVPDSTVSFGTLYVLLLQALTAGYSSLISLTFLAFHLYLVATNQTSIEWSLKRKPNPYDLNSVFSNAKQMIGDNPLLWPFPVGKPPGDGLSFPRNPQFADATLRPETTYKEAHSEPSGLSPSSGPPPPPLNLPPQFS